ncbi:hypothetical protein [Confluentibacter flavum]|uniref:Uncharacterized protein n=1 Tax=Confluentibacter flavum TaxID=1909700 RepID=A0A2N3HHH3_9FLAO|nr:hypothetical protein [Confluentibacter flavum]PKQ44268.1 hypothetical protein CSW08_14300 [Confluentibacter flavum]
MKLKQSLIVALILSIIGLTSWELFWRSQGYYPTLDDNKDLWAVQRAKLKTLTNQDVVLTGSSRVLFDIQLDAWEEETKKRPLQLASVGSSPLPIFHDIVETTDFAGTIIVGVTPTLFFSTTYPLADPWRRTQIRADFHHERTYAQRLNHHLSIPLQNSLAFMINYEERGYADEINLRGLLQKVKIGNRIKNDFPAFHDFGDIDLDRNMKMREKTVTDTAFANSIIRVWGWYATAFPPPDKASTMPFFVKDAKKFMARGGNLILLRCPSTGGFRMGENAVSPRKDYWDELVAQTKAKAYHFEDYEQLKYLDCPEWSHLSVKDANYFTKELVKIMKADGALSHSKTN